MGTVFLAGHGQWNIRENGFTRVRKGLSVTFYTEFSKNMFTADMLAIIGGTYAGSVKDVYAEGAEVPNYTLYPDTVNEPTCRQLIKSRNDPGFGLMMVIAGQTSTMEKLLSVLAPGTNAVWCACRYTGLKDVGGKSIGVNAAQGTYGNRDAQGKLKSSGAYYFNPGTANRQLHTEVNSNDVLRYALSSRRKAMGY
jgi:hypothetical protein